MFSCFLCKKPHKTISGLTYHFKIIHKLASDSIYRCSQGGNCFRVFSSFNSFKKHLKKVHYGDERSQGSNIVFNSEQNYSETHDYNSEEIEVDLDQPADTEEVHDIDINCFLESIKQQARVFVAKMYAKESLPRSMVQVIIDEFSNFLSGGFVDVLQKRIKLKLMSCNVDQDYIRDTDNMFNCLQNPFEFLSSEYFRLKDMKNSEHFIPPVAHKIGYRYESKYIENHTVLKQVDVNIQCIPLRHTLTKLFEMKGFHETVSNYVHSLTTNNSNVTNFIQGELWKSKTSMFDKKDQVYPLFIYFDEYETCNPLGSHAGIYKLGAVYVSFPFLPPHLRSILDNIFLVSLFHSDDRKTFGNKRVFTYLIKELIHLERCGIEIKVENQIKRIHFVLGLLIGDNLGLNSILGFTESFSANFYCRFCVTSRTNAESTCSATNLIPRNKQNYIDHVKSNDVTSTGVKEMCVFNEISSFHVTENFSVDIMHDVLEGICHYDMKNLLNYYINVRKLFSLETLNHRIKTFNYGPTDGRNRPPLISDNFRSKSKISTSAAEMLTLVKYFGLIIGDLIPIGEKVWELYLSLRDILDIILSNIVTPGLANMLETFINEHHDLYKESFNDTLKPKFHLVVHYPSIMRKIGPLKHIWCMRFESKHRQSKITAMNTFSRRNIIYSLALKHQLIMCNRFLINNELTKHLIIGPDSDNEFLTIPTIPETFTTSNCPKWVTFEGIFYKPNMIVVVGTQELIPKLGLVYKLLCNDQDLYLCCKSIDILQFNFHFHAYEIEINHNELFGIQAKDLYDPFPVHIVHMDNKNYVTFCGYFS